MESELVSAKHRVGTTRHVPLTIADLSAPTQTVELGAGKQVSDQTTILKRR